ncbi:hypothetical protein SAMN06265339_1111 [Desulfurobacterium pacificum]|uniref:Lipoprotein n=1 Tax=Desulfurobacterium pacificum TaxID=240166 RepID=A0ABY1NMJ1_9BACT|nr:hypothetical protein [Desulfurobacterium pacificum]SMP13410.1 hypothetical protein SAMN06265339_1111 [Desulfurobacterium pacificum]
MRKLLTVATLLVFLGSCGGGGSSESSVNSASITGVAVDGYLENATVCFDLNDNNKCDEGEPVAYTDENGKFLLKVPGSEIGKHRVVVEAIENVTKDNGTAVLGNFTLLSLTGNYTVVSPLTTVAAYLEENGTVSGDVAGEILQSFAPGLLGDSSMVVEDYIKTGQMQVAGLARNLARLMIQLRKLGLDENQIYAYAVLKFPQIAVLSENDTAFENWLNSLDNKTMIESELEFAEEAKMGKVFSNGTFYNFVVDWDNNTGINFISLRKSVFSDLSSGSGEVVFYGSDIDGNDTEYPDILVNSTSDVSNWSRKYSFSLELDNGSLVFDNVTSFDNEGLVSDNETFRVVAVSKINLSGITLNYKYIFPDDRDTEIYRLGLNDFKVTFSNGTAYLLSLVSDRGVKDMYLFDETAANQIIKALRNWYSPAENLYGKTLYHFVIDWDNSTGNHFVSLRKDVFQINIDSGNGTYDVYRFDIDDNATSYIDLVVNNVDDVTNYDWLPDYDFNATIYDDGEIGLNGTNGNYKVISVVKRNLEGEQLPAYEIFIDEKQDSADLEDLNLQNWGATFSRGYEYIVWIDNGTSVIPRYLFDENATNQIIQQLPHQ